MPIFMGMDPGTRNYAYSVISVKGNKFSVIECGKLVNIVNDLKQPHQCVLRAHLNEVQTLLDDYDIVGIAQERYMVRGVQSGVSCEGVNLMLGALAVSTSVPITIMPAAVWKNRANKFFDLKAFYDKVRVEPHEVDATFQGVWHAEKQTGKELFSCMRDEKFVAKLIKQIENKTTSTLKKVKTTKKKAVVNKGRKKAKTVK